MLIDDLLNNPIWKKTGVIDPLRERLTKVPKFILRCDFAMAVDELIHINWSKDVHKIVPLCRLPYQECWIEVLNADRLRYRATAIRNYEFPVRRVGWLLTQISTSGTWVVQMFWSVDTRDHEFQRLKAISDPDFWGNAPLGAAIVAIRFDPHAANADDAIEPHYFSDFAVRTAELTKTPIKDLHNMEGALSDWSGEGSFLMAALALLNSKNVVEYTDVSFKKKNKTAAKAGQSPLYDHKVISIHTRYSKRNLKSDASDGHKFRSHWCRGHFKIRKTGVFFWSPHRRGSLDLGHTRPKDYEVRL